MIYLQIGQDLYTCQYILLTEKLGYLRAIYSDYMIIMRGVIKLIKYFIPKSAAKSITKDSIKLRIMAYEANSNILI
jgi:hypothetical protein